MDDIALLRRTAQLCLSCLRGIAYYRAGQDCKDRWIKDDFWRHNSNNSLDMAIMDWCKLFSDRKAVHYWKRSVSDTESFRPKMLDTANVSEDEYIQYLKELNNYRGKFLAHLDKDNVMFIPDLDIAVHTACCLYDELMNSSFDDNPESGKAFYESRLKYAKDKYPNTINRD